MRILCSRRNPRTACPVLDCGGWQEPLSLLELSHPSQGGCPKITPSGALCPQSCPALGFSCCSRPTSQLSRRVEAFPRGLEAPGCSSLRPRGRSSPTPTSLLATAGLPSPLLCIFSLGGGLGAGNPAHILSPPSLGGPSSLGLKPERRLWSGEGAQLIAQNCREGKLCCGRGLGGLFQTYFPFRLPSQ